MYISDLIGAQLRIMTLRYSIFISEFMLHDHLYIREFLDFPYHFNFSSCKSDTYSLLKQQIAKVLVLPVY